jgi:hypothetical protein
LLVLSTCLSSLLARPCIATIHCSNAGLAVTHYGAICADAEFHTKSEIYPPGYRATRLYWSTTTAGLLVPYECAVSSGTLRLLFRGISQMRAYLLSSTIVFTAARSRREHVARL